MTPEQIAAHELAAKEQARGIGARSRRFAGGHRVARIAKFAGEQSKKAAVRKSRKKMAKSSQRKNRG